MSSSSCYNNTRPMMNHQSTAIHHHHHQHPYVRPKFKCSLCVFFIKSTCSLGNDCSYVSKILNKTNRHPIQDPFFSMGLTSTSSLVTTEDDDQSFSSQSPLLEQKSKQQQHHKKKKKICNITSRNQFYWQELVDSLLLTPPQTDKSFCCGASHALSSKKNLSSFRLTSGMVLCHKCITCLEQVEEENMSAALPSLPLVGRQKSPTAAFFGGAEEDNEVDDHMVGIFGEAGVSYAEEDEDVAINDINILGNTSNDNDGGFGYDNDVQLTSSNASTSSSPVSSVLDSPTESLYDDEQLMDLLSDDDLCDEALIRRLQEQIERERSENTPNPSLSYEEKKNVLDGDPTVEQLVARMKLDQYKNVIIIAGAGISVSAGIPDFRTKGVGLYYTLSNYGFKLSQPEDIFDLAYFRDVDPRPYFTLAKELIGDPRNPRYKPTVAHKFIKTLHDQGILLRCYTQNIDGLERLANIPPEMLVEAHGTFASASCIDCGKKFDVQTYVSPLVNRDKIPFCDRCNPTQEISIPYKGLVKHDIVFFGEDLPESFYQMSKVDFKKADLLIVMGTSMQVYPVAGLVHKVAPTVPRLLINMNAVGVFDKEDDTDNYRDISLLGSCDSSCEKLMQMLGWNHQPLSNNKVD